MTIRERIQQGEFKNPVPFPNTFGKLKTSDAYMKKLAQLREYRDAGRKAIEAFRIAMEHEYGMNGHPKALLLWTKAWDMGHSSGLLEVVLWYEYLLELVK